jgi:YidC/Oxa1 family membrane protein insertase
VKTVFFPLQFGMYKSMSKMRLLQPEMKSIQERFAADPQRMRQEQAKLWQREKINPLAGCLPIIPTMFVFYALFHTLAVTIEMRHTPFFGWIRDMSAPDPTTIFNLFGLIPWNPSSPDRRLRTSASGHALWRNGSASGPSTPPATDAARHHARSR